jgi:hypothetical protein
MPPISRPVAIQGSAGGVAATLTVMPTGRDASAFMAITVQSPLRTAQVRVCVPGPAACAVQMPACPGGTAGADPACSV